MSRNQPDRIDLNETDLAIKAIAKATKNNPIIIDFDETLLLRNSTAEYINTFRPRLIGFSLTMLLKIIKPWYWLPRPYRGDKTRDWFLVVVPTLLLPWTVLLWRKKAKKLAVEYSNTEIVSAVNHNADASIIIASLGFNLAISPILKHIPMRSDRLVSCRFWRASDRQKGKLLMMQEVLSAEEIASAILITDSQDDLPLLQVVEQPCLVQWSSAKYIDPFQDFWLYGWLKKFSK